MGVVNVTPDSFSDGGRWTEPAAAIDHALELESQGASFIDIGGESTRPGASRVDEAEQIRRVIPVVEGLRARSTIAISVDTTRTAVARAALDAGATIINDVAAGDEGETVALAAARGCTIVLMHRLTTPDRDSYSHSYTSAPAYGDVVGEVCTWLEQRARRAMEAGVSRDRIWIDPGLGFGKSVEQNFELLEGVEHCAALGFPVLLSISRKSFVGARFGISEPAMRDAASISLATAAVQRGAAVIRAHDVGGHMRALAHLLSPSTAP